MKVKSMIEYTEHEARERIDALAATPRTRPYILGIVGPPASGKSTLAEGAGLPLLAMDGYHYADEHLERLALADRKGAPETFDVGGYVSALMRLRSGEDIVVPRFDRGLEAAIAGAVPLSADSSIILTEGNYLLLDRDGWEKVRPLLDEVWYIELDEEVRNGRLLRRHQEFGRDADAAVAWMASVDEPNARLIESTRGRADAFVIQEGGHVN